MCTVLTRRSSETIESLFTIRKKVSGRYLEYFVVVSGASLVVEGVGKQVVIDFGQVAHSYHIIEAHRQHGVHETVDLQVTYTN